MTPFSHALFGVAAGIVLSPWLEKRGVSRGRTVALSLAGTLAPDVDALAMAFNKKVYYGLHWYSHHGFTHSLVGVALLSLLVASLLQPSRLMGSFRDSAIRSRWLASAGAVLTGGLLHLPCDMVTPPGPWGGIPLLAPFSWERFGGWCFINWKSYDLIYLALLVQLVFLLVWLLEWRLKRRSLLLPLLSLLVLLLASQRVLSARYVGFDRWKEEQQRAVGPTLYDFARRAEARFFRWVRDLEKRF